MLYVISAHNKLVYSNNLLSSRITTESNNEIFIITIYCYLLSEVYNRFKTKYIKVPESRLKNVYCLGMQRFSIITFKY